MTLFITNNKLLSLDFSRLYVMKKGILLVIISLVIIFRISAQDEGFNLIGQDLNDRLNTVTTAVPFLMIAPDSRSGAMGDVGVATSPDANSMHWNPAKFAFAEDDKLRFALSHAVFNLLIALAFFVISFLFFLLNS